MRIKYNDEELAAAVKKSFSYSDVCRELGLVPRGGNLKTIRKKIALLKIDSSHFKGQGWSKGLTIVEHKSLRRKNIEDVLTENSTSNSDSLKRRLLINGLKEYKCERCGGTEWLGDKIPLQLHHKNGVHNDNRLCNIELLCPNCHAQTDNYAGKNKSKQDNVVIHVFNRKDKEVGSYIKCEYCNNVFLKKYDNQRYCSQECFNKARDRFDKFDVNILINAFIENKSFSAVGKLLGVSDNAVRKLCKRAGIPSTRKELDYFIKTFTN